MLSDSQHVLSQTLTRVLQDEVSIIRCFHNLLESMPSQGSVNYQVGPALLMKRFFTAGYKIATDAVFRAKTRPGSLLVPRLRNKETSWEKFFQALTREDMNLLPDGDEDDFTSSTFHEGDEVELFSGRLGDYRPQKMMLLRDRMIDAQIDYLMELVIASRLFPEFICLYLGIRRETITCVQELSASSLKILKGCVLFPRIVHLRSITSDEPGVPARKVSAWAYEILADVSLGCMRAEILELLRYDVQFASHRQDIISNLSDFIHAREEMRTESEI